MDCSASPSQGCGKKTPVTKTETAPVYYYDFTGKDANLVDPVKLKSYYDEISALTAFPKSYKGLVVWDETVPATSNVALNCPEFTLQRDSSYLWLRPAAGKLKLELRTILSVLIGAITARPKALNVMNTF